MSFNRRGPDRRPDRPDRDRPDRSDRPPQRRGDWQPRERAGGDRPDRPYQPRGGQDRPYQPRGGGDRPYQPRGGDRPYQQRPRYEGGGQPDEGAMSIRLDPRRVNTLKHLAGEAGVRPGDLVRQWVEERLDASRPGADAAPAGAGVLARLDELTARVAALEAAAGPAEPAPGAPAEEASTPEATAGGPEISEAPSEPKSRGRPRRTASAAPSGPRVALHDEMIAIIKERGPLPAGELAEAITERGRYMPPRSGKPLDSATVSQRVSNPTYRSRFKRSDGRIGLADADPE